jgi:hypothetical protein
MYRTMNFPLFVVNVFHVSEVNPIPAREWGGLAGHFAARLLPHLHSLDTKRPPLRFLVHRLPS